MGCLRSAFLYKYLCMYVCMCACTCVLYACLSIVVHLFSECNITLIQWPLEESINIRWLIALVKTLYEWLHSTHIIVYQYNINVCLYCIVDPTPSCELYQGKICYARGVIGKDYVFVDSRNNGGRVMDQAFWEDALRNFNESVVNTVRSEGAPQSCVDEILSLMCFNTFPACDYGHPDSRPRQVCIYH